MTALSPGMTGVTVSVHEGCVVNQHKHVSRNRLRGKTTLYIMYIYWYIHVACNGCKFSGTCNSVTSYLFAELRVLGLVGLDVFAQRAGVCVALRATVEAAGIGLLKQPNVAACRIMQQKSEEMSIPYNIRVLHSNKKRSR